MTTNHPDKLDAALTRPSRVDKMFNFGYADKSSIEAFFVSSTNHSLNWSSPKILDLSIDFAELVPAEQFTAAEIQSYLLGFKDEPEVAVKRAAEWVKDTMGVKSCSSNS
ncbi:hypothetical protein N7455_001732 [Penicillium solitum]|uniref:uncharacterized protein n=1 Tax=Penicillium solitum TaxID=60172 RepID=UPI0032C49BD8|nr:hypothetical protein N7536_005776 [Penicillium majusculum]KAJ5878267.1 hypothetical protein N7455_001732 [Penicillium solitum]